MNHVLPAPLFGYYLMPVFLIFGGLTISLFYLMKRTKTPGKRIVFLILGTILALISGIILLVIVSELRAA